MWHKFERTQNVVSYMDRQGFLFFAFQKIKGKIIIHNSLKKKMHFYFHCQENWIALFTNILYECTLTWYTALFWIKWSCRAIIINTIVFTFYKWIRRILYYQLIFLKLTSKKLLRLQIRQWNKNYVCFIFMFVIGTG